MTSTSKTILWSGAAIAILLLGVVVCGALIFRRVIRNDRAGSERQEQHRASVDAYIDELTENRTGDPPEFLYHVEYRILRTPYPTVATMQQRLGTADSIKTVGSETPLEWLRQPNRQTGTLRGDLWEGG